MLNPERDDSSTVFFKKLQPCDQLGFHLVVAAVFKRCSELMKIDLENRLRAGETDLFAEVFTINRSRIWQIVNFRLDHKVRGRVDPDDVVQEVYLAAQKRLEHFVGGGFDSFFLWLRLVAMQTLSNVHRTHLGTSSRSTLKESKPMSADRFGKTASCLSQHFAAHLTSPSQAAVRGELVDLAQQAIESMNEIDREVLTMRHFEELTNQEVAIELGISVKAASIRYVRALERLRSILKEV